MKPTNKPVRYHSFTSTPNIAPATEHPAGLVTTRPCDPASHPRCAPTRRTQPRRALIPCLFAVLALLGFAPPEATAQAVQQVYPDSPLIPDATPAFTAGQSFRLLFLTSGSRDATQFNLKTYNDYVIAQAKTDTTNTITSFGDEFRALVSVVTQESNSARANTATTDNPGLPIYWLKGTKVADNYGDFYDGDWDNLEPRDQNGNLVTVTSSLRVWTGSTAMGTAITDDFLRSAGQTRVQVGRLDGIGGPINAGAGENRPKGDSLPFYALSPVISIIVRPDPTLSALSLSGNPPMFPAFDSATTVYAYSVPNETDSVEITSTFTGPTATLTIGTDSPFFIDSGEIWAIPLSEGNTDVRIVLTATADNGDVFTRTYTLTINRLPEPPAPPDEGILQIDSPLVPRGMLIGSKIRLLFVGDSSTPIPTDYSHYNDTVIGSAAAGHPHLHPFSDQFRALISTHEVDARDNTATRPGGPDVPIYWVGGDKVADSYGDFYDGSWDSQVPRDRRGVPFDSTQEILTGSLASGVGLPLNRIGDDTNGVRFGLLSRGEGEEIDAGTGNATDSRRLYALSPVLTLVAGGPQPPMVLTPIPDQDATVRAPFEYTIPANTFEDLNNDELAYSVSGPDWLSFDAATRRVSGTPPSSAFDPADVPTPITITVTASDGNPASADGSDSFTLRLSAGMPRPPANVRVTTGDGSIRVAWDPVTDNGGYPVQRYRVTINMPSTLTCDVDSASVSFCAFDTGVSNGVSYSDIAVAVFAGPQSDNTPFSSSTELGSDFVVVPTAAPDPNAFITTWRTTTANESITIPTNSAHTYAYNVDWGDSVTDATTHNGDASHTYAIAGDYVVSITGAFPQIYFNNTSAHRAKIRNIRQWGNQVWASMQNSFYGAGNLTILGNAGSPDLSAVTNTSGMFQGAILINHLGGDWDVSNVTNMRAMFQSTLSFNADISAWVINTDTDIDMSQMFNNARVFSADISAWNVSRVTDMNTMFKDAHAFNADISAWEINTDTDTDIDMSQMFNNAQAFNADISGWNVSRVTDMSTMFSGARAFNADISGWNVSRVTNMSDMFNGALVFNQNLGAWDVGAVTTAANMLVGTTLSRENYDALLRGWSEVIGGEGELNSNVSFHAGSSEYCDFVARDQLAGAPRNWMITDGGLAMNCPLVAGAFVTTWAVTAGQTLTIPTNSAAGSYDYAVYWGDDTAASKAQSGNASHTYTNAGNYTVTISGDFPQLNLGGGGSNAAARTSFRSVEQWGDQVWGSMANSFSGVSNFGFAPTAGQPNLALGTSMQSMFQGATFNSPIGHWDVSNVTNMANMFQNSRSFNQDLSDWDVSGVTDLNRMFNGATAFDQNLGAWDVSSATTLTAMFNAVTLSTTNYDSLLAGWSEIDSDESPLQPDISFGFGPGNSKYCNTAARAILTGAPNNWTITDGGLDSNCTLQFVPAGASIDDQTYTRGGAITLFLPSATGGAAPLTYSLAPLPPGLTFVESTRILVGTPTVVNTAGTAVTYTVTDNTGATIMLPALFRVAAFDLPAIDDQSYSEHFPSPALSLPAATGGVGDLSYTLTPSTLPPGLIYDPATRVISGTPSAARTATIYSYRVTDSNLATLTQTFMLVVSPALTLGAIDPQVYTGGQTIVFSLPKAVGGIGPLTYTLTRSDGSPVLPSGLTFNALDRTIKGSAGTGYGGGGDDANLDFTVTDAVGTSVTSSFTLRVVSPLTFGLASIADQFYITNREVNMTLPTATGGDGTLSYTLTPAGNIPPGLNFDPDPSELTISGTPNVERTTVSLVYRVTDSIPESLALTFAVTVVDGLVVAIITDSIEIGTPASRNTDIANSADGPITFTFTWSEPIDEFLRSDIDVDGGEKGMFTPVVPGATYTLVVTPTPNTNDGMMTVSVPANVAIGQTTTRNNIASEATQAYDTQAPAVPTISVISGDGFINSFERIPGAIVEGGVESGASVALCFDGTDSVATCTDGTMATPTTLTATTWSYALSANTIANDLGEGDHIVRAVATDAAGNPSGPASRSFTVDFEALPPTFDDITGPDNFITAAEKALGVTLTGTVSETGTSLRLCFGGDNTTTCNGLLRNIGDGITVTGTDWRYTLLDADFDFIGQGETSVRGRTTDAAGNQGAYNSNPYIFNVDTSVPLFTSGDIGVVAVNATSATVPPAYDATATDNGGGPDEGITYTLGGDDEDRFSIVADTGIVTYDDIQNVVTTDPHHRIVITATDTNGNTNTQDVTIEVRNTAAVIITDSVAGDYASIADGALTFTFTFSEPIGAGEFTLADIISVEGGTAATMLTTITDNVRYALVVTPTDTNDGAVTVTVRANAVTGMTTGAVNPETMLSQKVDNVAPMFAAASDSAVFIINHPVITEAYNADATDGDGNDTGITYSLTGLNAGVFNINPGTGSVTYRTSQTDVVVHTITITATDKGGNTNTITVNIVATTIPTVTSVTAPNGFYRAGNMVPITVTFSAAVTVSGTPQLTLIAGNSGGAGGANYTGGSGTTELIFTYSVLPGDNIGEYHGEGANDESDRRILAAGPYLNDLAYSGTGALIPNGGTIHLDSDITQLATAALDADLTLPVPSEVNSLSHSSDVVLDTDKPMALSATVTAQGGKIDVGLSEALTPASLAALDSAEFVLTGTTAMVREVITDPAYQVLILVLTDPDDPNVAIIQPSDTVTLAWTAGSGDTITDAAGNVLDAITNLSVTNVEEAPVVALVVPSNVTPPQNKAGDDVHIVVTFTTSVTVAGGVPQLTLDIGGTPGSALYLSGSPGAELTFRYTVADGHNTAALGYPSVNALSLNGGSIQRTPTATATGPLAADLTLPEPGVPTSLSGFFFPVVIDTIAPAVPSIDDPIAGDNRISVAERNADVGVEIEGSHEAGSSITLCFGATTATDPLCAGGLTYEATVSDTTTFAQGWSYGLDAVDLTEIAGGASTLTAIATDAAGNTAVSASIFISVDAIAPPGIDDPVATDNFINSDERTNGVTVTGTHDAALTVMLCVGGTYDPTPLPKFFIPDPPPTRQPGEAPAVVTFKLGEFPFDAKEFLDSLPGQLCEGGMIYAAEGGLGTIFDGESVPVGTDGGEIVGGVLVGGTEVPIKGIVGMPIGRAWSVALDTAAIDAAGEGSVTLTAIAFDTLGGVTVSPGHDITVDTTAPTADSASINAGGTNIVVTVSEPLVLTNLGSLDGNEFAVEGTTAPTAVTAVSTDGTELRLSIDTAIPSGETVTLTWKAPTGDIITDTVGNILGAFAGLLVTIIDVAPTFDTPIAGDNRINLAERTDGVTITGTQVRDASVTLCINGSDNACTGGTTRDTTEDTPTTWRYTLTTADHALMPDGDVVLRATAVVEGLSGTISQDITVDTIPPQGELSIATPISDDNIIIGDNANNVCSQRRIMEGTPAQIVCTARGLFTDPRAGTLQPGEDGYDELEPSSYKAGVSTTFTFDGILDTTKSRAPSVTISGTSAERGVSITLCAGATDATDPTCAGGTRFEDAFFVGVTTGWLLTLTADNINALGFGPVTLTVMTEDAAGNTAVSEGVVVTVIPPFVAAPTLVAFSAVANADRTSITVTLSDPVRLEGVVDGTRDFTIPEDEAVVVAVSATSNTLTLTLDMALTADTVTLSFSRVSSGSIRSVTDDFFLRAFSTQVLSPTDLAVVAATANSAGTSIAVMLSASVTLTDSVDGSEFTLSGNSNTFAKVTAVSVVGDTLTLSVAPSIQPDTRVRLAWTASTDDSITDADGNTLATFTNWPVLVAVTAPTAVSAVADGTNIAVTLSEPVTLTGVDGSEFTLSGTVGVTVTGISNSGLTLTLSLNSAIQPGARVTLAYAADNGDIIADVAGNAMSDFSNLPVATSTAVVVDVTAANGVYTAGESVPITVTFSDVVTVTGTPQLALNTGAAAPYTGGSGTASLTFTYSVRPGDNIGDLAYTGTGALSGTIQSAGGINLTLPTPGDANSLSGSSNVVLDNTAPAAPTFDAVGDLEGAPTGRSNRLNAADLTDKLQSSDGVPWGGSVEAGATVTLCLAGSGDGTGASCGTGRTLRAATTVGARWSYTLTLVDLAAMGEGAEIVTAFATDAAGNVSGDGSYDLIIDTVAPVFISGNSGAVAINAATTVIAYDANARDNGGVVDNGIAYTLGATTSPVVTYTAAELATLTFIANELAIDSGTGVITFQNVQTTAVVDQTIVITATDLAGNTATQEVALSVLDGTITLTITDDVATAADIATGDVTFSFNFSEDVTDFVTGDITVDGGDKGAFAGSGRAYTLVVTLPNVATNDGTLTVTVAASMATGETTSAVNAETTATQAYDTQAPAAPGIVATIATDNIINIAERDAGVEVSGTTEAEVGITLCAGATDVTDPTCDGGTTFLVRLPDASSNTTWSYTLTADDISAIGDREVTLTAIATDGAGNAAVSDVVSVTVDTVAPSAPAIDAPVAGDNMVNATDTTVTVTGTKETAAVVTLCIGATEATDVDCDGGTRYDTIPTTFTGGVWTYTLTTAQVTALPQGSVTLTAIATDAAGNPTASPGIDITVDTIAPVFTSGITGSVGVGEATTAIAYDAEATDNGLGSEIADTGISYTLGGDDALTFMIDPDSGEVTYKVVQTSATIAPHHVITITATDAAGNTATTQPVTISVLNAPTVTITDNFAGDYTAGGTALTFTFTFSEVVTGFTADDIVVEPTADSVGAIIVASNFTEVTAGQVYTQDLLFYGGANPHDGTVTVRVPADAVIGTVSTLGNIESTASQQYDSVNPASNALSEVTLAFDVAGGATIEVYNAQFTDGGGDDDAGISYSLTDAVDSSGDAALFTINPGSGSVTFNAAPTAGVTYEIVITGEDKAGRSASIRLTINAVTIPVVDSVTATDGFYTDGDSVPITVTFSEAVTVVTTGGTPRLALTTGNSEGDGFADYTGGSGSAVLTFTYSVRAGDNSRDLAYAGITALSENGGAIQNAAATVAADLTLSAPGPANPLSLTSTVVLDNTDPVFTPASTADNRISVLIAINSDTTSEIYTAAATDSGRMANEGITYALVGTHASTFRIDSNGVLTPAMLLNAVDTYTFEITAADEVNNVATQYLSVGVVDRPTVTITDSIEAGTPETRRIDSVNLADSGVTFTLVFSEPVTGFDTDDITVSSRGNDIKGAFGTIVDGKRYTVVATPTSNIDDGVLTVTVMEGGATGTVTIGRTSAAASYTQNYDTLRPALSFAQVAGDDVININEQTDTITGTISETGTLVTLCFGGSDAACTGGMMQPADVPTGGTAWSYTLTAADVDELGEGDNIVLRATAIDEAGNSGEGTHTIGVDTEAPAAPTFEAFVSGDNLITAADSTAGVTINGEVAAGETGASVSLCFGGTDDACTNGRTQAADVPTGGTAWSYMLEGDDYTALGQGTVTVRATATDAAGNIGATGSKKFMVDTIPPVFRSGNSGVIARNAPTTTVAYDAEATNNGLGSEFADAGISYTLGGTDALTFMIDAGSGEVRYNEMQADLITHNITIIATDTAGNPSAPHAVRIDVRNIPTVKITGTVPGFANGDTLTLTFTFNEPVTAFDTDAGFEMDDITVTGGSFGMPVPVTDGMVYTLAVTPNSNNAGTITVTVRADAVRSVMTTNANVETSVSQRYDSVVPVFAVGPTDEATLVIGAPIADSVYNAAATDGVGMPDDGITYTLSGTGTVPFEINSENGEVTYTSTLANTEADYDVEITATDKGGNTAVVTVTVMVVFSDDANLANLQVASDLTPAGEIITVIQIAPPFDAAITTYTANVGVGVTAVTVIAPPVRSTDGMVAITGTAADSSTLTAEIPTGIATDNTDTRRVSGLTEGANTITIAVTAPDGTTKTYTLTVNVASAPTVVSPATVKSVFATDGDGAYSTEDEVMITIVFSEAVTASVSGVQLTLNTGNSDDGIARYFSGSGSAELIFRYTVRTGDDTGNTGRLSYTGTDALSGGTIQVGSDAVTRTLPVPGETDSLSHFSAVVLDNTAPVFTETSAVGSRITAPVATETPPTVEFYNADATDRGRPTDTGITYAVTGTDRNSFAIDPNSGALSPTVTLSATATTLSIEITATDEANNVATQYLTVDVVDVPTVTITDTIAAGTPDSRITDTANIADDALTFTFAFNEEVRGFDTSAITVGGGNKGDFATLAPGLTFTVTATPLANTNVGTLTITVAAGVAASTTTGRVNLETTWEQVYDTVAPAVPGIDIVATDDIINFVELSSAIITGTNEAGVESVTLCFGGTDSACTDGTERPADVTGMTWSYTLVPTTDIPAIGQGTNRILRAIAADNAGNTTEGIRPIRVDTDPPIAPVISLVAGDNTINAAEQTSAIIGTTETDTASVSLCINGTDAACTGGRRRDATVSGTNWSYTLVATDITAIGQGTNKILRAYATDTAGNTSEAGSRTISVDTTVPVFSSGAIGAVAVGMTSNTVTAYDAEATDNGGAADAGISYTLSGTNAEEFNFDVATGIVTYGTAQTITAIHTIVITATDTAGNPAMRTVTISVLNTPAIIITDSVAGDYASIADGALTFTFTFSEPIVADGFALDDIISVEGGTSAPTLTTITPDVRYTLVVTPEAGTNDGTITVTVRANAVTGITNDGAVNPETMLSQKVDNVAPMFAAASDSATETAVGDPVSTLVYTATATDDDVADNRITYMLSRTDATMFNINANTGAVTYSASPNTAGTFEVTITATDKGGNTATITVTVTVDKGAQSDFGFANPTVSKILGEDDATFTATASGGPGTGAVTYASGDAEIATVTNSGLVNIVAVGSTTITATKAADVNYNQATASYVLTVFMTQEIDLPDGVSGATVSGYVTLPVVDTVVVDEPPATATDNPPAGIKFSLTTDLSLLRMTTTTTTPLAVAATVCLPTTTGVPSDREPILFHYFTAADQAADTWNEIGRDTATRDGVDFVCGETTTFSPFAVGYTVIKGNQPDFVFANPTVSKMVGDDPFTVTASGGSGTGAVTYTSDNTEVASVMLNTGEVTIVAAGRTTITATKAADPDYNEATATYVLTVFMTTAATRLNEQILTRASQAMTASTLEAVARRVEAAAGGTGNSAGGTGTTPALAYQFGGQSSLNGLLKSHGKAMLEDNMEYEQLFDGASFVVPLSAAEGGTGGGKSGAGALSLWGSSDFINLGSDNDGVDWDGQVTSINVGVDKLVGKEMLAGFALSSNQSSFDYDDAVNKAKGEYNYSNTILHPYIGWFPGEDLKLWASVGFGSGEIEINDDRKHSTGTTQQSLSGGFNRWLLNSTELLSGGATTVNLKGDVSMTSVDVEAKEGSFDAQKVSNTRLRVLVSGEQQRGLANGGGLTPLLEAGVRYDGGDGVTGTGVELGGGLRYANPGGNVTVAGNVRALLAHGYDESGMDFLLQLSPSAGRGLSLSLHPVWGKTQSVADKLWNDGASEIADEAGSDTSPQSSLDAEVGYGVAASIFGAPGVLTPYTGMTATDGDTSRLRLGSRFADGNGLSLNLEGARENTADGANHIVLLRGEVSF